MDVAITAIGTAVPRYKRKQMETAELIAHSLQLNKTERKILNAVYKKTGIDSRYSVLSDYCETAGQLTFFPNHPTTPFPSTAKRMKIYEANALPLALDAIKNCLAETNVSLYDITHLITVSCTGMYAPGLDIEIVTACKLKPSIQRTAINFMGCYGAFNALKVAAAICQANPNAKVLIVCVELCTIHFQNKMEMDNLISNAIFADGAAAVMIEANPKQNKFFSLSGFHCDLIAQTKQEMAWHIADSGFDIVLSTFVPEIIENGITAFFQHLLQQNACTFADIDFYAIHPGGLKILKACEKALQLKTEDNRYAYNVLKNYGNMSSATILFVLQAIWQDITPQHHQKNIFSCAFGPGLTLESMFVRTYYA